MAIEYDLDISTRSPAVEIADWLAEIGRNNGVFDAPITGGQLIDKGAFVYTRLGTCITVAPQRPPHPWDPIVSGLGFAPTVSVGFRMGKEEETSDQQDDMISLVAPLLERVDGDAVLHFQFEQVWLLRKAGELSLSENDDLWRPRRLALVTQPYRRQTHIIDEE